MLESPKAQDVFNALQSSSGFKSIAGDKAVAAVAKSADLFSQIGELINLPEDGIPAGGQLPTIVPVEIRDAAKKISEYQTMIGTAKTVGEGLSNVIGQRMSNITGNMAMANAAVSVAQAMGKVPSGCGAIGAAFSVLTSEGRTDLLNSLMDSIDGPLSEISGVFQEALGLGSGNLSGALKSALDAAMSACDAVMQQIDKAAAAIKDLVKEAVDMWNTLDSVLTDAIHSSILMSVLKNPCLAAVTDAVCPKEVNDILNSI
ncbi:MAG: DUF7217 family protein [Aeromonas sp.]